MSLSIPCELFEVSESSQFSLSESELNQRHVNWNRNPISLYLGYCLYYHYGCTITTQAWAEQAILLGPSADPGQPVQSTPMEVDSEGPGVDTQAAAQEAEDSEPRPPTQKQQMMEAANYLAEEAMQEAAREMLDNDKAKTFRAKRGNNAVDPEYKEFFDRLQSEGARGNATFLALAQDNKHIHQTFAQAEQAKVERQARAQQRLALAKHYNILAPTPCLWSAEMRVEVFDVRWNLRNTTQFWHLYTSSARKHKESSELRNPWALILDSHLIDSELRLKGLFRGSCPLPFQDANRAYFLPKPGREGMCLLQTPVGT